jgi:hypothetical protein
MEPNKKIKKLKGFTEKVLSREQLNLLNHPFISGATYKYLLEIPTDGHNSVWLIRTAGIILSLQTFRTDTLINHRVSETIEPLEVSFLSSLTNESKEDLISHMNDWFGSVSINNINEHKRNMILKQVEPTGVISKIWELDGCFPYQVTIGSTPYDDDDTFELDASFNVDNFTIRFES